MIRAISIMMLAALLPEQLYAYDFRGLSTDTQMEYFVPRPSDKPQEQNDRKLTEKIREEPPKGADAENSGTNWWLWGGLGLAAVAGGLAALVSVGSKGGGSTVSSGGSTTTTVTGSW